MMKSRNDGRYRGNPCLTMHQPWASLLVHGIKRIEGRSWTSPIRGRLWIHAAGKVPDDATIKAMEDFYREIYALNGITDLKFPEHYPVSRLIGCVEVVGCLRSEELACWQEVPEGVRLEGQTLFCWLCEQPQRLLVPLEMRGYQGVYNLERKISEAAVGGLVPVGSPLPVKFPLPNPSDPLSLKPGSVFTYFPESRSAKVEISSRLSAVIAGARAAATQFSNKDQSSQRKAIESRHITTSTRVGQLNSKSFEKDKMSADQAGTLVYRTPNEEQRDSGTFKGSSGSHRESPRPELSHHPGASSKIFAAAMRGLR